ncbi:MAG: hypothetical protein KDD44_11535, partial [Bdellovibrionales bacterium]|nr:hypothetical protein [Bdellovibrionales bacterium]
ASQVFEMLTTSNSLRATAIARAIDKLNADRRAIEDRVRSECLAQIQESPGLLEQPALALFGDEFHLGVIGIVAQRLVQQFYKPSAVMARAEAVVQGRVRPVIKGSIRGVRGLHVADALQELDSLLVAHGGHREAGGFTLLEKHLAAFQEGFVQTVSVRLPEAARIRERRADVRAPLQAIDHTFVEELQLLQPFGMANAAPLIVSQSVTVENVASLRNGHLRVRFRDASGYGQAVCWGFQGHPLLRTGNCVTIAYQPELNAYQGISSVQLNLKEVWQEKESSH